MIPESRIHAIAQERVNVIRRGNRLMLDIATNPGLEPARETPSGGVAPGSLEARTASAALCYRMQVELGEGSRLSLQAWLQREVDKRGGRGLKGQGTLKLAADLRGIDLKLRVRPRGSKAWGPTWNDTIEKALQAEKRKIEEYLKPSGGITRPYFEGKYDTPGGQRRARIAGLPGGEEGNPFLVGSSALWDSQLRKATLIGAIRGDWQISESGYPYTIKRADPEPPRGDYLPLHDAIRRTADDLDEVIPAMVDLFIGQVDHRGSYTTLTRCYAIFVDAII